MSNEPIAVVTGTYSDYATMQTIDPPLMLSTNTELYTTSTWAPASMNYNYVVESHWVNDSPEKKMIKRLIESLDNCVSDLEHLMSVPDSAYARPDESLIAEANTVLKEAKAFIK